ncbi:molecular chaperone TorD family protein [Halodesulfurarchaeum sp. HSR-GB]|uniref:TorD/DmsD family molecular chaperone n=1 Tax=Halodesulfurarchaeum sp. HSR-GB TaxID=3074077 RepID=UPI002854BBD4|nr:molecular chaperone TorD family protein [Halodesulfurarchaeum sp. HSR-GB]MDR5656575.1 molecular chaperone TorD family protein [Halodesulfurarchaeum sp. HSR-GB]
MTEPLEDVDIGRIYGLLSECFKHPDEQFTEDVGAGALEAELEPVAETLDIEYETGVDPDLVPESAAAFDNEYISLFEAFETPYAPAVESPYKEWHEGVAGDGLLDGPPADDMRERYATLDIEIPDAYMPDHLALLLEYASLLVEAGTEEQHRVFVADHLDWLPAFRKLVADAAADAPFHRRYVTVTDAVVRAVRQDLGIEEPDAETVQTMLSRVEDGMEGVPEEKTFRP